MLLLCKHSIHYSGHVRVFSYYCGLNYWGTQPNNYAQLVNTWTVVILHNFEHSPIFNNCKMYIASINSSGFADVDLKHAVNTFNGLVSTQDTILIGSTVDSPIPQKVLSFKIDTEQFRALLDSSSPANKARLLSASAPHTSSWLSVVPSVELGLHLDPHEFCVGIRWWLGLDISRGSLS